MTARLISLNKSTCAFFLAISDDPNDSINYILGDAPKHSASANQMALHSSPGCFQSVPAYQTGLVGGGGYCLGHVGCNVLRRERDVL
jgi:hypothetical protein